MTELPTRKAPLATNALAALIQPSATMAVTARAKQLKAEGKAVLGFSAGEPDFRPPQPVVRAVQEYISTKAVKYAPVSGMPALRDAAAADLAKFHGRTFERGEIMVSCGAKHCLANLMLVTLSPGDEVVISAPYWVSYPAQVQLGGGTPVIVNASKQHGLRVQPEDLERVLSPRTKYVLLNSPSNPTGVGYTAEQIRALGEVVVRKAPQAWFLCDDIYRHLTYDGFEQVSAYRALSDLTEQFVFADGVSKSHAMTGFRIGFLAAPKQVIAAAGRIQGQMTSGATTTSQIAAIAALTDPACAAAMAEMRAAFARRRALMLEGLRAIPGVSVPTPDGAFYVFADVSQHVGEGTQFADDLALATWLLDEKLVATVPGTAFGAPGNLRISYATDDASLREGVARLHEAFSSFPTARG